MQRRHKRMELVRPADRKRRRYGGYFTGEIELTRRMFLLKGLILGGFTVLAGKLWKMQVLDVQDYEDLAMGKVDELDDPIDKGVAQRDQGNERPVCQPKN